MHVHTHCVNCVFHTVPQGDRRDEEEVRETDLSTVFDKTVTRYVCSCMYVVVVVQLLFSTLGVHAQGLII